MSESAQPPASFLVAPNTSAVVVGLPEGTEFSSDLASMLSSVIRKLPDDLRNQNRGTCPELVVSCSPLVCGGIVIQPIEAKPVQ